MVIRELPAPVRDQLPSFQDLQGVVAKLKAELNQLHTEGDDDE